MLKGRHRRRRYLQEHLATSPGTDVTVASDAYPPRSVSRTPSTELSEDVRSNEEVTDRSPSAAVQNVEPSSERAQHAFNEVPRALERLAFSKLFLRRTKEGEGGLKGGLNENKNSTNACGFCYGSLVNGSNRAVVLIILLLCTTSPAFVFKNCLDLVRKSLCLVCK